MTKHSDEGTFFKSLKFTDWATVKEALIAKDVGGVFILAPMAMQLVADGVPIKVVLQTATASQQISEPSPHLSRCTMVILAAPVCKSPVRAVQ